MLVPPDELERKAAELRARLKYWELGYLTALVEGEGSLDIFFNKKAERGYPRIQIYNTNLNILNYFKRKLNIGDIYLKHQEGNRKTMYMWNIGGKEGLVFLKMIFDGLFSCKKIKASLLLALNLNNKGIFVRKINDRIKYLNSIEENISLNRPQRSKFSIKNITEFNLGIMAGLLDGEGSVIINKTYRGARVGIASTCPKIIYKVLTLSQGWGFGIIDENPQRKAYHLTLYNQNALIFLELIKDYLIIKKERAEIAIEFIKTLNKSRTIYIPDEIKRRREELYYHLRALNTRGRIYSGGPTTLASSHPRLGIAWEIPRALVLIDV